MVLTDLYKIFEKRKRNMQDIINNGHSLALDKKHEIKGAVNEIDIFLRTIEHFQNAPVETDEINLITVKKREGFFNKLFKK